MNNNEYDDKPKNNNVDSETEEIIRDFVSEAYHLLDKAVGIISQIDSENNTEAINTIFRLFHSLKGSAGFLNFKNVRKLTHEAETLLDLFRENKITPKYSHIDVLYQTFDLLEEQIISISNNLHDKGFEEKTDIIVNKISNTIKDIIGKDKIEDHIELHDTKLKKEKFSLSEFSFLKEVRKKDKDEITPEIVNQFKEEANKVIDRLMDVIDKLKENPYDKELVLDLLKFDYNLKNASEAFQYKDINDITTKVEMLINSVLVENTTVKEKLIQILNHAFIIIKNHINTIEPEKGNYHPEKIVEKENIIEKIDELLKEKPTSGVYKPLGEILVEMGVIDDFTVEEALQRQKSESREEKEFTPQDKIRSDFFRKEDVIRVDTNKLDQLFDLVGELTIAELMVTHNEDIANLNLENLSKANENLTKITGDLQSLVMSIRMTSMESLFNKIVRVVNQLSKTAGKKVKVNTIGATTEIDRKLINEIYDPLIHIVRNAVDHGIESEQERLSNNKPPIGKIYIEAKHEGNEIWISVEDDGAGLNKQGIIGKAMKKGMITSRDLANLTDESIYRFIFEPGFSTAANVSEISGRGVGMDVVKKNIEKLRGTVEIQTEKNKFTKITLKIPVTLEIMRAMVVIVGDNKYSIPVTDVIETISLEDLKFFTIEGNKKAINLRDEIIPAVKLNEVFNNGKRGEVKLNGISKIAVIVSKNKKKVCVVIDEIVGTQQIVIKSLPKYMGQLKNVSGCSIIGNGEISLILDTGSIINNLLE